MPTFCISNTPLENGVYELHNSKCHFLPPDRKLRFLGEFENSYAAMVVARTIHESANGCYCCCKEAYYSHYEEEYEELLHVQYGEASSPEKCPAL